MINYDIEQDRTFKIINMLIADDIKRDPSRAKFYEERKAIAEVEAAAEKRRMEAQLKEQMEYLGLTEDDLKIEEGLTQDGIPFKALEELEAISRENEREYDKNLVEYMAYLDKQKEEQAKQHKRFEELIAIAKERGLKKPPFKNVNEAAAYIASKKDNVINVDFEAPTLEVDKKERKIKVLLDNVEIKVKPEKTDKKSFNSLNKRLRKNSVELTVEEFINNVSYYHAFSIANYHYINKYLNYQKIAANWKEQDILALDFDDKGMTPEKALGRCNFFGLKPICMYSSLSDSNEERRFRLIFLLEETLTDVRDAKTLINALMEIFPETDEKCKDVARLFFGGKKLLYKDTTARITPHKIMEVLASVFYRKSNKNWKRDFSKFCTNLGINTLNGVPKFSEKKSQILIDNIEHEENSQSVFDYFADKDEVINKDDVKEPYKGKMNKEKVKRELERGFNFKELENKCPLWNGFINGKIYPFDNEFLGIALNLLTLEGGEKRLKEAISKMENKKHAEYYLSKIPYYKANYAAPELCEKFCPKHLDKRYKRVDLEEANKCDCCCNRGVIMLHAVNNKQNTIRKVEGIKLKTREDAKKELDTIINLSLKDASNSIDIIAAPTGIGKTTALVKNKELLKYNTIIAYPNHKLGKEIFNKFGLKEGEYVYLKDLEIDNKAILTEYRRLQSLGAYGAANKHLEKYQNDLTIKYQDASNLEKNNILKELNIISEYMFYKKEAKITNKVIFCSHAMALLLKNNNVNQIIFDEDIFLSSCFSNIEINLNDLSVAINAASINENGSTYKQLSKLKEKVDIALSTPNTIVNIPTFVIDDKEVNEIIRHNQHLNINIKELLKIKIIISDIKGNVIGAYLKELPNKKCIVLSATANQTIYEAAFKDREVNFFDLGNVEQTGKVVLHYQSYSKQALINNFKKLVEKIREEAPGIDNIISYKSFNDKFENEGFKAIAHFGACAGIDAYKGQNLIVAGTPRPDGRIYPLLVNLLRPGTTTVENKQENVNVINNGWEFSIYSYNEENGTTSGLLQQIQFYLIESEIAQAVGRARTLWEDATVHLFSNYPLRECILYKENNKATTTVAA